MYNKQKMVFHHSWDIYFHTFDEYKSRIFIEKKHEYHLFNQHPFLHFSNIKFILVTDYCLKENKYVAFDLSWNIFILTPLWNKNLFKSLSSRFPGTYQ